MSLQTTIRFKQLQMTFDHQQQPSVSLSVSTMTVFSLMFQHQLFTHNCQSSRNLFHTLFVVFLVIVRVCIEKDFRGGLCL